MSALDTVAVRNMLLNYNDEHTRRIYKSQGYQLGGTGSLPDYEWYREQVLQTLQMHPMYYVSKEMCDLATAHDLGSVNKAGFEVHNVDDVDNVGFEAYDLPSKRGFMLLQGGVALPDARGNPMAHNAIAWWQNGPNQVVIVWFADKYDMRDRANQVNAATFPDRYAAQDRYEFSSMSIVNFNQPPMAVATLRMPDGSPLPDDLYFRFTNTVQGQEQVELYREVDGRRFIDNETDVVITPVYNTRFSLLLTIWHLMQQTITTLTDEEPPRAARRASVRMNAETKVTVIELRKVKRTYREGSGTALDHRYIRRGHWRRQPYKDVDGTWRRKWILIQPTVVGPADKPLIIREHINALVR